MAAQRNVKRVQLEKLFRWSRKLDIRDQTGEIVGTIHQRILNERDLEKSRLAALRFSRETRLALKNPDSDEHAAFMESMTQMDTENKVSIIIMEEIPDLYEKARVQVRIKLPKPPSSKTGKLENYENYEQSLDDYDSMVAKTIGEEIEALTTARKDALLQLTEEELDRKALKSIENQICSNVMSARFDEETAWRSVYVDPKFEVSYFKNYNEFDQLAVEVKKQLVEGYKELSLSKGELKN